MENSATELISGIMMLILVLSPSALVFAFGTFLVGKGKRIGYSLASAIFSIAVLLITKSLLHDEFEESFGTAINGLITHFLGLPLLALAWKYFGPNWPKKTIL